MVNKNYKGILISIVLHAFILYLISTLEIKKPHSKPTLSEPIQSFLYIPKVLPSPSVLVKNQEPVNQIIPSNTSPDLINENSYKPKPKPKETNKNKNLEQVNKDKDQKPIKVTSTQSINNKVSISSKQLLDNFRKQLNNKIIEQNLNEINQHRSLSSMHQKLESVPYSAPVYNAIEEREKNTTHYSDGLKITKNSNGTCTIETDLSAVGIQGIKAIESFGCGESTMEKNFRLHMKKVKDKWK